MNTSRAKQNPNLKKGKLSELSLEQRQELANWLTGGMTYAAAKKNLAQHFGVTASLATLSGFWYRECSPRIDADAAASVLDVVLQSDAPIRITILKQGSGINIVQTPPAKA